MLETSLMEDLAPELFRTELKADPGAVVSTAIDHERVVGCVVYCSTGIVEPGVIRHIEGT
jgi:hypothetical protein